MSAILACRLQPLPSLPGTSFKPLQPKRPSPFLSSASPLSSPSLKCSKLRTTAVVVSAARVLRPVEERFKIQSEKNISTERIEQLNVKRWCKWESDKCTYQWEWQVDEQVYIVKGSLQVTPEGCEDSAWFYAGDLVRFPKWFVADLSFDGEYEQRYRFLAYGDD